ncbi:glycosyltransferase family 4 protein [Paenibacillus sp. FSL L8-0323]|uniref:glycosyltransferase family 4 protein n=1 Tax=unclassified Paenibacillus TaxID=185978 RepID=UPI00096DBD06|nr:capsular biosynthesis protein [Paenibacillus odorifer]
MKILFLSNHFITLYSFRKELIKRLIEDGHEVYLSIPKSDENSYFSNMGCKIVETSVDRRGINPFKDFYLLCKYIKIMKGIIPDIIFSYTIKPNIYGSIASNITKRIQVNNITGTGATFLKESFVSRLVILLYKISVKNSWMVFFQNSGDKDFFIDHKMIRDNYIVLPGSGVNLEQYSATDMPSGSEINFIFIGRIMKLKGIEEYLSCAEILKGRYSNVNFYIAGFIEEDKYKKIIKEYSNQGIIKYIGFQKDIKTWIQKCHCTVLPSHGGEGIPNVLLESAAMGRACIASNINGSNDVITDGVTGYLFETGSRGDLSVKLEQFIQLSNNERNQMGQLGREKVERQFDRRFVIEAYIEELEKVKTLE